MPNQVVEPQKTTYARYEDYISKSCLKNEADAQNVPGRQNLQKANWTDIHQRMMKEGEPFRYALMGKPR